MAAAAHQVLVSEYPNQTAALDADYTGAPVSTAERHFTNSGQLIAEIADARVWGGVHFRFSTTAGTRIGAAVARYDYRHALQPLRDRD